MDDTWLGMAEAARRAGVSPDTVRRWCNTGRLPSIRTDGGHRRVSARVLEALVRDGSVEQLGVTRETRDIAAVFRNWTEQIDRLRPFLERPFDSPAALEQAYLALVGVGSRRGGLLEALEGLARELKDVVRLDGVEGH